MSGLPASGKSSLGRLLSSALGWPLLDKDAFLEALFAQATPENAEQRNALSRHADMQFRSAAEAAGDSILVSWWRHPQSPDMSGTSTRWLADGTCSVIEVFCECPASIALKRFLDRTRHPGHLDAARDRQALAAQLVAAERLGPLGLFPLVRFDTSRSVDLAIVRRRILDRIVDVR